MVPLGKSCSSFASVSAAAMSQASLVTSTPKLSQASLAITHPRKKSLYAANCARRLRCETNDMYTHVPNTVDCLHAIYLCIFPKQALRSIGFLIVFFRARFLLFLYCWYYHYVNIIITKKHI